MHDISTYHNIYHAEHLFKKRAIFRIDIALSRLSRYLDIQARRTHLYLVKLSRKGEGWSKLSTWFMDDSEDTTTIPDETDHENDDDADCDIVMKMKQAGAKNFFS